MKEPLKRMHLARVAARATPTLRDAACAARSWYSRGIPLRVPWPLSCGCPGPFLAAAQLGARATSVVAHTGTRAAASSVFGEDYMVPLQGGVHL